MVENPPGAHRATIVKRFAGTERTFCLTLGECLALEQRIGNLVNLVRNPAAVGVTEAVAIFFHALRGGGAKLTIENTIKIIEGEQLAPVIAMAKEILLAAMTDPAPDEGTGADSGNPPNGTS